MNVKEVQLLYKDHGWVHVDDNAVPKVKATNAKAADKAAMQTRLRQNQHVLPPELVGATGVGRASALGAESTTAEASEPTLRRHVGMEIWHSLQLDAVYSSSRCEMAVRATNDELHMLHGHPEVQVELKAIADMLAQVHRRLGAVEATHTLPQHVARVVHNPPLDALIERLVGPPGTDRKWAPPKEHTAFVGKSDNNGDAKDHGEKPKQMPLSHHCSHCFDMLFHLVWLIGSFFDGRSRRQDVCSSTTSGR